MALTYANLKSLVQHTLGASPTAVWTDADTTEEQIISDALEYLFAMHEWQWRNRPPVYLDLTADQSWVELPADFGQADDIRSSDNLSRVFEWVSMSQLMEYRAASLPTVSGYFGALSYPNQDDKDSHAPKPRLEIWPTPTSSTSDALRLSYMAGPIALDADTDVPNIPRWVEPLLQELVKVHAKGLQEEDEGSLSARVEEIERSTMLKRLKARDANTQPFYGPSEPGVTRTPRQVIWSFNPTSNPS